MTSAIARENSSSAWPGGGASFGARGESRFGGRFTASFSSTLVANLPAVVAKDSPGPGRPPRYDRLHTHWRMLMLVPTVLLVTLLSQTSVVTQPITEIVGTV